ncbi:MAG: cobyrinate a,c-diamide synthase [Thiotrichales bacterium]
MLGLYLSAAHKSSGKTTVSLGLSAALQQHGKQVQTFKKGPDYIDPIWLARASGRPCVNLDFYTSSHAEIQSSFEAYRQNADIVLVEGNKGLYDGMDLLGSDCNASMAKLLKLPVLLVLDATGVTRGIAPLLVGYQQFDPEVELGGVILNKVAGPRHEEKLRAAIEAYSDIPILGAIPRQRNLDIEERHLGLVPANEDPAAQETIDSLAELITRHVDLKAVLETACDLPSPRIVQEENLKSFAGLRIGRFHDAAFGFYYADDLDQFRKLGVELIEIDAINEESLPEIHGLFIGGGFPETHMAKLEANQAMRQAVRDAIEQGMPVYAECGGLMYLSQCIRWGDEVAEMAGVIPAETVMSARPKGRGYIQLDTRVDHPWPFQAGDHVAAHEFHYSQLEGLASKAGSMAYDVKRGIGIHELTDGFRYKNLLASYAHLRNTRQSPWVQQFVEFVAATKSRSV